MDHINKIRSSYPRRKRTGYFGEQSFIFENLSVLNARRLAALLYGETPVSPTPFPLPHSSPRQAVGESCVQIKKGMVRRVRPLRQAHRKIAGGVVHKMPEDLRKALISSPRAMAAWEDITPLARNEWICWVESVKKLETRKRHIKRTREELIEGKRRPCCWVGCIHR